ncbi:electron transport complex protein RnfB [Pseudomonas sp. StFLB209]|uniref:electron transport complex subunit RsxB n=1 Tax=Pseudomonas sp. StFLB209 TaxID=1028989 RepID=UPI0004F863DA|nr:electron transport complex subunit RsxB [Pseudomonas sp. StFLB209]BAP41183.1 electron transport complex protein RnfB [Pseudomonas sp. StFLB209]
MSLIQRIDALLPQTQCGKCGHPGCLPYAQGIASGEAINKCPPGGTETIASLAQLLRIPALPLDTERGAAPAQVAFIREAECIGCTKCIQACPVDAIVGAAKMMHTVLVDECTGCDLCVAPCPVDCIDLLPLPSANVVPIVGDLAYDAAQLQARDRKRNHARQRYEQRTARLRREQEQRQARSHKPQPAPGRAVERQIPTPRNNQPQNDQALKQARITLNLSRAQLNRSLKAFGHPPIREQAMRLLQMQHEVQAAEQAVAALEQAPAPSPAAVQPASKPAGDLKRAKIQLAMARAALSKAQANNEPASQLAMLSVQLHNAEQAVQAAEQP